MPHSPSKEDTNHHDLNRLRAKEFYFGLCSIHINLDLFDALDLIGGHLSFLEQVLKIFIGYPSEVMFHHIIILLSFSRKGVY